MRMLDNTLRDGGNVVGHGFTFQLTAGILPMAAKVSC